MGNELSRMENLDQHPPLNLATSLRTFCNRYGNKLDALNIFRPNSVVKNYYLKVAETEGISSSHAVVNDISFITFISAHLKYTFEDKKCVDSLSFCKIFLLPQLSGINPVALQQSRIHELSLRVYDSFSEYQKRKQKFQILLLINGYIRAINKQYNLFIPVVIIELCNAFYYEVDGNYEIEADQMKLSDCTWNYEISIQQEKCIRKWSADENIYFGHTPWMNDEYWETDELWSSQRNYSLLEEIIKDTNGWTQFQVWSLDFAPSFRRLWSLKHSEWLKLVYLRVAEFFELLNKETLTLANRPDDKIININSSALVQCEPICIARLLQQTQQLASYVLVIPACERPANDRNIYKTASGYDCNMDMECYRDMAYFIYLNRNQSSKECNQSEISDCNLYTPYFKEKIPMINIKAADEACTFNVQQIFIEILTQSDKAQSMLDVSSLAKNLIQNRQRKVFTVAFALTVRKQMLQIKDKNTPFQWNLELDYEMTKAAYELIKIFDEYVYTVVRSYDSVNLWCDNN